MRRALALVLGTVIMVAHPLTPAGAAVDEQVQVRPLAGNATAWVSPELFVGLSAPAEYERAACCLDGNSGEWEGPSYQHVDNPSIVDVASINWSVTAVKDALDAEDAALSNRIHDWPVVDSGTMLVPRMENGQVVGTVDAYWALTKCETTDCAQYEGLVSFYIGNAIHVVAHIDALSPSGDDYVVDGGRVPSSFNADKVHETIATLRLEGPFDARCSADPSVVCGGDEADTIVGTSGDDAIFGGGGNDSIESGDGNDTLAGDAGDDVIDAGAGDDEATGGGGNDRVFAKGGNDLAKGGGGNDLLRMADGLDMAVGGGGRDVIEGGPGFDEINGGKGFDICYFSSRKEKKAMKGCEEKRPDKRAH
jgi:hypothetical protein